jgi:hypothetical protein
MRGINILLSVGVALMVSSCLLPGEHCPGEDDTMTTANCSSFPDAGPCEAQIIKYYYDEQAGMCKEFAWGGCEGNVPFHTLKDCEECSGTKTPDNPNEGAIGSVN